MSQHSPDFAQLPMLMLFHHNTDSNPCLGRYQPDNEYIYAPDSGRKIHILTNQTCLACYNLDKLIYVPYPYSPYIDPLSYIKTKIKSFCLDEILMPAGLRQSFLLQIGSGWLSSILACGFRWLVSQERAGFFRGQFSGGAFFEVTQVQVSHPDALECRDMVAEACQHAAHLSLPALVHGYAVVKRRLCFYLFYNYGIGHAVLKLKT